MTNYMDAALFVEGAKKLITRLISRVDLPILTGSWPNLRLVGDWLFLPFIIILLLFFTFTPPCTHALTSILCNCVE